MLFEFAEVEKPVAEGAEGEPLYQIGLYNADFMYSA